MISHVSENILSYFILLGCLGALKRIQRRENWDETTNDARKPFQPASGWSGIKKCE